MGKLARFSSEFAHQCAKTSIFRAIFTRNVRKSLNFCTNMETLIRILNLKLEFFKCLNFSLASEMGTNEKPSELQNIFSSIPTEDGISENIFNEEPTWIRYEDVPSSRVVLDNPSLRYIDNSIKPTVKYIYDIQPYLRFPDGVNPSMMSRSDPSFQNLILSEGAVYVFIHWTYDKYDINADNKKLKGIEYLEQNQIFKPQYLKNSML